MWFVLLCLYCQFWTHWLLGDLDAILKMQLYHFVFLIGIFRSYNALRCMTHDLTDEKSTLVQVMAWCHQATNHYLNQCWPRSMMLYGVTEPQWINWSVCYMCLYIFIPSDSTKLKGGYTGFKSSHYDDVIMTRMASQITSLAIVYSTVYSGADQSKHQSSASLAFVWEIHRGPVNFPHKWPVTRKMFPFDDVIMRPSVDKSLSALYLPQY